MNAYECIGEIHMGSLHIFAYLCIFCVFLCIFKFEYDGIFILVHIQAYYAYMCIFGILVRKLILSAFRNFFKICVSVSD